MRLYIGHCQARRHHNAWRHVGGGGNLVLAGTRWVHVEGGDAKAQRKSDRGISIWPRAGSCERLRQRPLHYEMRRPAEGPRSVEDAGDKRVAPSMSTFSTPSKQGILVYSTSMIQPAGGEFQPHCPGHLTVAQHQLRHSSIIFLTALRKLLASLLEVLRAEPSALLAYRRGTTRRSPYSVNEQENAAVGEPYPAPRNGAKAAPQDTDSPRGPQKVLQREIRGLKSKMELNFCILKYSSVLLCMEAAAASFIPARVWKSVLQVGLNGRS
jgi:hypothetical protein